MAEPAPITKDELASKLVQEVARKGNEIPEKYLYKEGFPEAIDDPDSWNSDLLIDLSLLSSSASELAKLRSALSEWGCFQVINHGMDSSFLEEMIDVSKQFFELPLDEKLKCSAPDDVFQGGMIDEYSKNLATITEAIYKAMARSLNLDEDCFIIHQGKQGPITGRISLYPRCPCPDRVLGLKPHSDGATMGILLPEKDVEGLQVLKDDQWYRVPVIPGALFINFGDLGEVMTNGEFKSVIHRVVTNVAKDRISVAAFCTPEDSKEIGPVSELVSIHRPPKYKRLSIHEFMQMFFQSSAKGCRTIDLVKL